MELVTRSYSDDSLSLSTYGVNRERRRLDKIVCVTANSDTTNLFLVYLKTH
jgi:hypothetical protein